MRKLSKMLLLSTALFSLPLYAAENSNNTVVNFEVSAQKPVVQDTLNARLVAQVQGKDLAKLKQQLDQKVEKLLARLAQYPTIRLLENQRYEYMKTDKDGKFSGWKSGVNIHLSSTDFAAMQQFLDKIGGNVAVNSLSFSISDKLRQQIGDELLKTALEKTEAKAALIQKNLQRQYYRLQKIEIQQPNENIQPRVLAAYSARANEVAEEQTAPVAGTRLLNLSIFATVELSDK
ncbi:hypothetical protein CEP48_07745 [Mergibacter septicus]|uniref:Uncharacterized protein n=1 Tax=Mergibacter septicus TaxID=221402 RepID=A0A8E3SC95_9PAST|nr:SIMPL domain-containing protein [Mergibacter septicus]AWX16067.1 hypothetical protein CEP47_07745 [Mergibacter septicus]QDJ15320.1 hypothetical protein CEP48_07745 [Mergibacter septicus]UTU48812.1 SIMPL domain-containing protein [Mergibacter septicus]WMR95558.1 SIMPL domain-containing protein [Mergibacter septicus]